jgi:hypothetical protein
LWRKPDKIFNELDRLFRKEIPEYAAIAEELDQIYQKPTI